MVFCSLKRYFGMHTGICRGVNGKQMISWKKNVFSYVIWLVYILLSGAVLFRQAGLIEEFLGGGVYVEIIAFICALVIAGDMALLLHLFAGRNRNAKKEGISVSILLEAAFAILLLFVGLVLRIWLLPEAGEQAMYFEAAKVADGQEIPRIVHGPSYVYLILLRVFFLFFGNKMIVGIWVQIVMQLLAALLLFFAVRKFSGPFAALILLLFVSCSDVAVHDAVILSPRILFLFLFALGISILCACKTKKLQPCLILLCGILAGMIGWLDAGGLMLILIGAAVVFSEWEQKPGGMRRAAAVVALLVGGAAGFFGVAAVDVACSQSTFEKVMYAWLQLYRPATVNVNSGIGNSISPWGILLAVLLLFNIFSFWMDRYHERMSVWVMAAGVAAAAEYFGLLTEELPAAMYLLFFLTVLAGVGVQECFRKEPEMVVSDEHLEESKGKAFSEEELSGKIEETGIVQEPYAGTRESGKTGEEKGPRFIENPLPLPKPHKRKVLDFDRDPSVDEWDFDYPVDKNDDFDIK